MAYHRCQVNLLFEKNTVSHIIIMLRTHKEENEFSDLYEAITLPGFHPEPRWGHTSPGFHPGPRWGK